MAGILKVDRVQSDSNLAFQVAGANVAYMNSTGLQMTGGTLSLGGTTIIPAVGQIAFPATQNASADANTLDDYEEGTFTPILTPGSGTITSYTASGYYTKIGRLVHMQMDINITSVGTAASTCAISGFPFLNAKPTYRGIGFGREDAVVGVQLQFWLDASSTGGIIRKYDDTTIWGNYRFLLNTTYYTS